MCDIQQQEGKKKKTIATHNMDGSPNHHVKKT